MGVVILLGSLSTSPKLQKGRRWPTMDYMESQCTSQGLFGAYQYGIKSSWVRDENLGTWAMGIASERAPVSLV